MNTENIAACGLYCGACRKFEKGDCLGCFKNEKAAWCKIRICCIDNNYKSCADCKLMPLQQCKKFNNFVGKVFALIFNSNRAACINRIKETGYAEFAAEMDEKKIMTLKRGK